jgi:hypothetical protein
MAQIIKKQSILGSKTVYFVSGTSWSDDKSLAKVYPNKSSANGVMNNPDGTNGGWSNATTETV